MLSQSAPSGDASALSISPVQPGVGHAPLTAVNAYAWAAAGGGDGGGAGEGRGLHCFLSSFGLCWLRQLIKNSIFISPIIHFDFIVEWVVGGAGLPREQGAGRLGGCCVGRKVSTGRGVAVAVAVGAQFQSVCFTFLHIDSTASKQKDERGRERGKNFHFGFRPFAF